MVRYQNGNLAPDMGSVFMPVDRCTRENSCLQVIPSFKSQNQQSNTHQAIFSMIWELRISYQVLAGSHHMGRVDHFMMGGQSGADPGRVEMAKKAMI